MLCRIFITCVLCHVMSVVELTPGSGHSDTLREIKADLQATYEHVIKGMLCYSMMLQAMLCVVT